MAVFGITMVRDEADIVRSTVEHMLSQVDEVIVADNLSTDGTAEILHDLPVTLLEDREPGYYQSRKMTALAQAASDQGADWVVPFDADEWWYSPFGRVADVLEQIPPDWLVASAELYDHVPTGLDPDVADPVKRIGWRRTVPAPLPKVACRVRPDLTIEQGNHGARYGVRPASYAGQLVVRHFPYRSAAQFISKARNGAAAYAATDLPEDAGAHWRGYGRILAEQGEAACADIFRHWFWQPDSDGLIYDPAP